MNKLIKKKITILGKDKMGWSIDKDRQNITKVMNKIEGISITKNPLGADIFFCVWYDYLANPILFYPLLILNKIKKIKIISVVTNDIRNYPEKIKKLSKIIDIWISPNLSIFKFLKEKGLETVHIPFSINSNIFSKSDVRRDDICKKLGIDFKKINRKYLIGSFQRDSLGTDLTKPKWQKNPDLLIKITDLLKSDDIILILAGPRRHYIVEKCNELKIPYLFIGDESYIKNLKDDIYINNLDDEKISLLYKLIDAYIVTSKSEGGPKSILESSISKTLVFSTRVGMAPDILHEKCLFSEDNITSLLDAIRSRDKFYDIINYNFANAMKALDEKSLIEKIKSITLN